MTSFLDLVQMPKFREYTMTRLSGGSKNLYYGFSSTFPILFRYRSLSTYAIDDIINEQVTATSIGEFNDLFDGAIHRYGNDTEQEAAAEKKWTELEKLRIEARLPVEILTQDYYVSLYKNHFKKDSRLKFRLLDYLGTYVCCFSSKADSTLMWSHYANSNKGICIAYDFNKWEQGNLQRNLLFPVTYSDTPIDVSDLLEDEQQRLWEYPLETAVLCAALNKASVWSYENEWRLLLVLASSLENTQRLPMKVFVKPSAIYFGNHFLKPCFYYDFKNSIERENCEKNIKNIDRLLDYMIQNQVPAYVMTPNVGSYTLKSMSIESQKLQGFIYKYFCDFMAQSMQYYTTIHDYLMNYIDGDYI
ncbi:MAG TPA: DUF2971 domain-containing protein [Lactovum miscens]|uniref:DUF2971 domain-containing protein n=1 Tax=Lactovum miscens TaxID=190387 RepID=UPI002ED7DA7E